MQAELQFETPENVQIQYQVAGLGTRFVSWFVDMILVGLLMLLTMILLATLGISLAGIAGNVFDPLVSDDSDELRPEQAMMIVFGMMALVWGFGSFVYYTLFELLMRGQTPGKKLGKIRVVKLDGFSLDAGSIVVRNIFRVLDHLPPMWAVPFFSKRSQRAGDLVAGTVVISDATENLPDVRAELSGRSAAEAEFRFDQRQLRQLSQADFDAVEALLDRWGELPVSQQAALSGKAINNLANKLQCDHPPPDRHVRFLEDLLGAELRRQDRALG